MSKNIEEKGGQVMQTAIFLIRHGETAWNSEGIFRGQSDIPLNERGLQQARATGEYLQAIDFNAVFYSPLSRARQTADALCRDRIIKPQSVDAFIDISFGPWEGQAYSKLETHYPEAIRIWREEPEKHQLEGAETLEEAKARAFNKLLRLAEENSGKNIAIVTHRVILKLLLLAAVGLNSSAFWKVKQDTCCINLLEYSAAKSFIIVKLNETCHLLSKNFDR
jgi:broad specificity phosphatase PhoE